MRKTEGNRKLWRTRGRWEDTIKMNLQEVGRGLWGLDGVGSGQGQVAGACEYGNELSWNFLISCKTSQLLKKDSAPWSE
jgi:hypothetical protein